MTWPYPNEGSIGPYNSVGVVLSDNQNRQGTDTHTHTLSSLPSGGLALANDNLCQPFVSFSTICSIGPEEVPLFL